jgi:hypothetical protein
MLYKKFKTSRIFVISGNVAEPGSISDPKYRTPIPTTATKEEGVKNYCRTFFVATNITNPDPGSWIRKKPISYSRSQEKLTNMLPYSYNNYSSGINDFVKWMKE